VIHFSEQLFDYERTNLSAKKSSRYHRLPLTAPFFKYGVQNPRSNCSALTLILLRWKIWWASNNASKWQIGFNAACKGLNKDVWVFTHGKLEKLRSLLCLSPHQTYSAYMTRGAIFIATYVWLLIFSKPILVNFTQSGTKNQRLCRIRQVILEGNVF